MVMHIPSFFVGSLATGSAFLLVHQQLSYRQRLTRKWPLAERVESEIRRQLKQLKAQIGSQSALAGVDEASFGKETVVRYYNQKLDSAIKFLEKKD